VLSLFKYSYLNKLKFQTATSYNLEFQNVTYERLIKLAMINGFMDITSWLDNLIKPLKVTLTDKQVLILIELSDNEGYSATELVDKIGSTKQYLSGQLGELSSFNFGNFEDSIKIKYFHFKDPLSLAHKIQGQRNPISKYIFKHMRNTTFDDLSSPLNLPQTICLGQAFEHVLLDQDLWSRERFSEIKLSEDAKKLIALKKDLTGGKIRFLNRILIEDAFPNEICKTRIPLITEIPRHEPNKSRRPYFINQDLRTFIIIAEHLTNQIKLSRAMLDFLNIRLEIELEPYRGLDKILRKDGAIYGEIKENGENIIYYRNRYENNINTLRKFTNSNYVKELNKKYDQIHLELSGLKDNEFDLMEFFGVKIPDLSKLKQQIKFYEKFLDLEEK
jgi:hypothetical protein